MDEGWKTLEVEPEVTEAHRNGKGDAANGVGPSMELVLGNGHQANGNGHEAVPVNGLPRTRYGNGHHDEAPEPPPSLFLVGGIHG